MPPRARGQALFYRSAGRRKDLFQSFSNPSGLTFNVPPVAFAGNPVSDGPILVHFKMQFKGNLVANGQKSGWRVALTGFFRD